MIYNLVIISVIFVLLQLANLTELLSYLSRPLVTETASLFGINAINRGTDIVLGSVVLPWTQDCSGVNTLIILWGVTLWASRNKRPGRLLAIRMILCIPAALIANMLRIFTIAAYRYIFYPAWESEELHYFFGFLWLIPFLFLFIDDFRRMGRSRWIEIIHLSLVLALLAPVIFAPGGSLVAIASLFYLAHTHTNNAISGKTVIAYLIWISAAFVIALSSMESLWIPWLLLCPRLAPWKVVFSWSGLVILSGTILVLAMHTEWQVIVAMALVYRVVPIIRGSQQKLSSEAGKPGNFELPLLALLGLAPFSLSAAIGLTHPVEIPPPGNMTRQITMNSYQIALTGQPADIRMYWYGAYGDGRHHSLESCMQFRGLELEALPEQPDVLTGGKMLMKDFYIHEGKLLNSYSEYLLASFSPFSAPGVHIILDAPADSMSASYFSRKSVELAERVHASYRERSMRIALNTAR
jgi:exosortase/archaeosortase family protein